MNTKTLTICLLAGTLFTQYACSEEKKTDNNTINSQVVQQASVIDVDAAEFKKLIEKEDGIILDVRTEGETSQGYIKGARFIDFYDKEFEQKIKLLPKDKPIYEIGRAHV